MYIDGQIYLNEEKGKKTVTQELLFISREKKINKLYAMVINLDWYYISTPFDLSVHLVDVYNMIESFRENGLNTLDHNTELHESRLEAIVSSIFYALNKRLPTTHNVDVERSIALVTSWLLCAYDG